MSETKHTGLMFMAPRQIALQRYYYIILHSLFIDALEHFQIQRRGLIYKWTVFRKNGKHG